MFFVGLQDDGGSQRLSRLFGVKANLLYGNTSPLLKQNKRQNTEDVLVRWFSPLWADLLHDPAPSFHCVQCVCSGGSRETRGLWCHISGLHLRHHTSLFLSRLIYFGFQLLILIRGCESDGLWQAAIALNLGGHILHHCTQQLLRFMAGFERSSSWLFSKGLNLESYWKTVEQPPGRNGVGGGFFFHPVFPPQVS